MTDPTLHERALKAGIIPEFKDLFGETQVASDETKAALLAAMGLGDGDAPEADPALPRYHVCEADQPCGMNLPQSWRIRCEDGTELEGRGAIFSPRSFISCRFLMVTRIGKPSYLSAVSVSIWRISSMFSFEATPFSAAMCRPSSASPRPSPSMASGTALLA